MTDAGPSRATLILPANATAARVVRLVASAIATDIGLAGDALDDVRHLAGELVGSLVRCSDGSSDGELIVHLEVNGQKLVVSGEVRPPTDRALLVEANVLQHAAAIGVGPRRDPGAFTFEVTRPSERVDAATATRPPGDGSSRPAR